MNFKNFEALQTISLHQLRPYEYLMLYCLWIQEVNKSRNKSEVLKGIFKKMLEPFFILPNFSEGSYFPKRLQTLFHHTQLPEICCKSMVPFSKKFGEIY